MAPLLAPPLPIDRPATTNRPSRPDRSTPDHLSRPVDRPAANSSIAAEPAICCYVNPSGQIQIARIANIPNWYFERVVFPHQRLLFEAPSQALLEIHTGTIASAILADTIPCGRLRVG